MVSAADTMDLKLSMLSNPGSGASSAAASTAGTGFPSDPSRPRSLAAICFASACKQNESVLHVDVTAS